jgi:hypothetical protein
LMPACSRGLSLMNLAARAILARREMPHVLC